MVTLTIGDTHCPGMRRGYVDFLKRTADNWQPSRVVHIGDLVDWHAISYHEKSPSLPDPKTEARKARRQVKAITDAFPEADLLTGNHDSLPERKATTAGIPDDLLQSFSEYWRLPDGWRVWPRFHRLKIDGVFYSHGETGAGGKFAAGNQAAEQFNSVVIGHLHSQAGVTWRANHEKRIFGLSVGCGVDHRRLQFAYGRKFSAKPMLGCGIVIDGRYAYFEPWDL
jgi:metallophosphoesterase superfamily enzyme